MLVVWKIQQEHVSVIVPVCVCVCQRQCPVSQVLWMWHAQALGEQTGTKLSPSGYISITATLDDMTWTCLSPRGSQHGSRRDDSRGGDERHRQRETVTGEPQTHTPEVGEHRRTCALTAGSTHTSSNMCLNRGIFVKFSWKSLNFVKTFYVWMDVESDSGIFWICRTLATLLKTVVQSTEIHVIISKILNCF